MLKQELTNQSFSVKLVYPPVVLGLFSSTKKVNKWIGYIDKYVISTIYFYLIGKFYNNYNLIHICDHSNAVYRKLFDSKKLVITCHDVLAIRGAMGFNDAYCKTSKTGKYLQKSILNNLTKFKRIACVSKTTLQQLQELSNEKNSKVTHWRYVPNTFNQAFESVGLNQLDEELKRFELKRDSYILHVGSDLERKNRRSLLEVLDLNKNLQLVITHPFRIDLPEFIKVKNQVFTFSKLSNKDLALIYQGASALVFPSFSEGFGWPIIEAQKSGIPVICSDIFIHREIAGNGALFANPNNPVDFLNAIESINNLEIRNGLIAKGFQNIERFNNQVFIKEILSLYRNL